MSPKGMQLARVDRLQLAFNPYSCCTSGNTVVTQGAVAGFDNRAIATEAFVPEGRKKFVRAAGTKGPPGPTPQALTVSGLSVAQFAPAPIAPLRFRTTI